jgi:hypothetical protein
LASLIAGRAIALVLHEASHACAASLCGYRCRLRVDVINQRGWCHVPGIGGTWAGRIVSATGWLTSVVLAAAAARVYVLAVEPSSSLLGAALGAAWTAAEAVCSDLLGFAGGASDAFHCGNFGLVLLHNACRHKVLPILRSMMTVTMMRGAQSAGVVTYWSDRGRRIGKRRRVVNGKRTDLATLLLGPEHGISRLWRSPTIEPAPAIYQGHTRFATSSRATIDGCHPHQWSPLAWCRYWRLDSSAAGSYKSVLAPVEAYVTHNGDLDFFRLGDDVDYPLEELQVLLPKLLDSPLPTTADSACIAGLVDLLRTRGLWAASVRYGLLFGALAGSGSLARLPDWFARAVIEQLASIFEAEFVRVLADYDHVYGEGIPTPPPSPPPDLAPPDSLRSSSCDKPQVPPIDVSSWWNPFGGTKRNTADSLGVSSLGVSLEEGGGSKRGDSKRADSVRGDSKRGDSIDGDSKRDQSSKRGDIKRSSSAFDADLPPPPTPPHQARLARELRKAILARLPELSRLIDIDRMHQSLGGQPLSPEKMQQRIDHFVSATIGAFFLNDLLSTGREVLARASGSFGLVLSHSLDAERELVVAARGQTMSVAFYPQLGLVLFGSEAAALKAGLSELELDESSKTGEAFNRRTGELKGAFRLDLDDLGGEVVLLAWGTEKPLLTVPYEASERAHVHAAAQGKDTHDPGSHGGPTRDDSKESTSSFKPLREDSHTKHTSEKEEVVEGIIRYVHDGKQRACGIVHYTEARQRVRPFIQRAIRLEGNSLILPLPPLAVPDPVGRDLRDIPGVLRMLQRDFADHQVSLNVPTAWTFASRVRRRLRRYEQGEADGSVDVLITGCEASLWVGEQFASDLALVFPGLKIVTLSANKLLGQLGQRFPIPQEGFQCHAKAYSFRESIVLLLSHSGGTFPVLSVCHLLKNVTTEMFIVGSEWDTQIGRAVREANARKNPVGGGGKAGFASYTFSTFAGVRTSEACSISVVAMHSLLSHVLLFTMNYLVDTTHASHVREEVQEIHGFLPDHLRAIELIVGVKAYDVDTYGNPIDRLDRSNESAVSSGSCLRRWACCCFPTGKQLSEWIDSLIQLIAGVLLELGHLEYSLKLFARLEKRRTARMIKVGNEVEAVVTDANQMLRAQGLRWAQHILESASCWIFSATYIAATVIMGATPLSAAFAYGLANIPSAMHTDQIGRMQWQYIIGVLDSIIYIFLPIWTAWCLRLIQGRPLMHRVAGRTLLIGDVPWVAQCTEAFVSKLFALSYSIADLQVWSANPQDHLVHRFTHRVRRGSLLAIGRPDARLNGLTSADSMIHLAINQACAIENLGANCECFTLGHHAHKIDLTNACLVLPTVRPKFLCELLLDAASKDRSAHGASGHGILSRAHEITPKERWQGALQSQRIQQAATDAKMTREKTGLAHGRRRAHAHGGSNGVYPIGVRRGAWPGEDVANQRRHGNFGGAIHSKSPPAARSKGKLNLPSIQKTAALEAAWDKPIDSAESFVKQNLNPNYLAEPVSIRSMIARRAGKGLSILMGTISPSDDTSQTPEDTQRSQGSASAGSTQRSQGAPWTCSTCSEASTSESPSASPCRNGPSGGGKSFKQRRASLLKAVVSAAKQPMRAQPLDTLDTVGEQVGGSTALMGKMSQLQTKSHASTRQILDDITESDTMDYSAPAVRALMSIHAIEQPYVGAWMRKPHRRAEYPSVGDMMDRQRNVQVLYETRLASLQRFVGFLVLFHTMAKKVQDFWSFVSFGLLSYDMSRSQSMLRVATTASPVSGSDVREQILALEQLETHAWASQRIRTNLYKHAMRNRMLKSMLNKVPNPRTLSNNRQSGQETPHKNGLSSMRNKVPNTGILSKDRQNDQETPHKNGLSSSSKSTSFEPSAPVKKTTPQAPATQCLLPMCSSSSSTCGKAVATKPPLPSESSPSGGKAVATKPPLPSESSPSGEIRELRPRLSSGEHRELRQRLSSGEIREFST